MAVTLAAAGTPPKSYIVTWSQVVATLPAGTF